jgi:predicted MPP superfamily phosphohydrolase
VSNHSLDLLFILLFAAVQWRISRLIVTAWPRWWARCAVLLFDALLVVSYAFTLSVMPAWLYLPGRMATMLGAGSLAYCMIATSMLGIHYVLRAARKHFGAETNPGRRRVLNTAGNALLVSPFAVMGYGALVQRTDFRVREIDIPLPGLPQDLDGLRLLQLSDIHLSAFLSEAELARVIDASNELRAHVAFITGDLISGHSDPLDACITQLARVRSDAGLLGCLGNHERFIRAEDYTTRQAARAGIQFLRGEARQLRFGASVLNIAGMDFQSHRERDRYLMGAERLIAPGTMNILLQHNPDVFPVAAAKGYNLLLAGHTHGGQVTFEILDQHISPARFLTPYVYGLYRRGDSAAYVTRGIGTIGIPARIGAPPEISLLRLRKA